MDTGHKLEESKPAVIARGENDFRGRIHEASEILCQSPTLNRDLGWDVCGDVLARDFVHPSSRDK